jgi:hypothetical protein
MFYEIHHADGSMSRMTLADATDAETEVAKWPDTMRVSVVKIVQVDRHSLPSPAEALASVPMAANVTAAPSEVKEIIIGLAETLSATRQEAQAARDGQEARIAALEATITALKGAV